MSAEPGRIRILAVDDHPVLRQGIAGAHCITTFGGGGVLGRR